MNKAKEVYFTEDGNMVKSTRDKNKGKLKKVAAEIQNKPLSLMGLYYNKCGVTFIFNDDDGHAYYMSDNVFNDWLEVHPVRFGGMTWDFLQQGSVYSIEFLEQDNA